MLYSGVLRMKIACPQCGQHYDVEAGMLDRYFRCTECQMLFRGLNAKPVKERKFKRKNNAAEQTTDNAEESLHEIENPAPGTTTAAVEVEDPDAARSGADAQFWEKSLEEDAVAEKAVNYRKRSINFAAYIPAACIVLLLVTFILAMFANSKVNDLTAEQKNFGNKGTAYKERLEKLEQRLEVLQNSVQNMAAAAEKVERSLTHLNEKVSDQALAKKVEDISKSLENCDKTAEEVKKLSAALAECREALDKMSAVKTPVRQRTARR